jgi:hypothetical protein
MWYFESNLFAHRLSKQLNWTENNLYLLLWLPKSVVRLFQYRARNRVMDYFWVNIDWIRQYEELYELLIYIMHTLSNLCGIARSRYWEHWLRKDMRMQSDLQRISSSMIAYFT